MPAGKHIATNYRVVVDNVDLSEWAFDVQVGDEKDRVDVSGFGGRREFLQGLQEQNVTVSFLNGWGTGEPMFVMRPLYESGSLFPFYVQPFNDSGGTATDTNPQLGGSATQIFTLPVSATLNERAELEIEFRPASNEGFAYGTSGTPAYGTV